MVFTPQQINAAKTVQTNAAHDAAPQIRLVAGPGTGKSFSVGERIAWLINQRVARNAIFSVSFTISAAEKLRATILKEQLTIANRKLQNRNSLSAILGGAVAIETLPAKEHNK